MKNWYYKYENLPFKMFGNDINTGIDCTNLINLIFKQERNIDLQANSKDLCNDHSDYWYQNINDNIMKNFFQDREDVFKEINKENIEIFDIILLSIGSTNISNHSVLYVDTNKILHTMENKKSWISPYGNHYRNYTEKVYRWKNI